MRGLESNLPGIEPSTGLRRYQDGLEIKNFVARNYSNEVFFLHSLFKGILKYFTQESMKKQLDTSADVLVLQKRDLKKGIRTSRESEEIFSGESKSSLAKDITHAFEQ